MIDSEYITIAKQEGVGKYTFGIEIKVASPTLPNLKQKEISFAVYKAIDLVKAEILAAMIQADQNTTLEIDENKKLTTIFPAPIFIEEIPNEYCSDYCCRHLPWFIVTTSIGRFKIGWRKRVIHLEWTDTLCNIYSADLFKDENTTKYDHYIHAWNLKKAKEYINTIIAATLNHNI